MSDLLTVAEVAAALKCSEQFVRDQLTRKHLRGSKLGGDKVGWRVSRADLEAYVAAKANVAPVRRRAS